MEFQTDNTTEVELTANADSAEYTENIALPEQASDDAQASEEPLTAAPAQRVEVVSIRFREGGKAYYFDPAGITLLPGDGAVTETARGVEYGIVTQGNKTVSETEIVSPLKTVLRKATDEDTARHNENMKKRDEAFRIFNDKVKEHHIDMSLVDVEYTFDNSKLLFYFTADGRVDFRDLVKDLASVFRTRIELRQIGIRDEAKLIGGLGICGRSLCCHSFLPDFVQVSIKMAKEQNLSLNSTKISGACGRLMCCLRYEHDVYEEEIAKTPRMDSVVMTSDGEAIVTEVNPLAGKIRVRFTGAKSDMPPKYFHRDEVERTELTKKDIRARDMAAKNTEVPAPAPKPAAASAAAEQTVSSAEKPPQDASGKPAQNRPHRPRPHNQQNRRDNREGKEPRENGKQPAAENKPAEGAEDNRSHGQNRRRFNGSRPRRNGQGKQGDSHGGENNSQNNNGNK